MNTTVNKSTQKSGNAELPNRENLLSILNSRFVIWLLGILFLSILPLIIKVTRLSYDDEKRSSLKKEMLQIEIYHRMKHIEMLQAPMDLGQLDDVLFAFYGLDDSLMKQRHWHYYNFKPIYSAYEKTPFRNLIIEFSTVQSNHHLIQKTKEISHLLDKMKHRFLIVDFELAKINIKGKTYYDVRRLAKDTSELRTIFLNPIRDWTSAVEEND